ncbi:hypothetical protein VTI28DRAFT_4664 [Corynascus sepedonium]
MSFEALQELVTNLTGPGQANSGKRSKIASHGRKLVYPFKRPKLQQLEGKLSSTHAALQLALQALELAVSVKYSATLESMLASHVTSQAADLLRVQSEVSAIGVPLRSIHSALSVFETRFENLGNGLDARLQKLETLVGATTQLLADNQIVTGDRQGITSEVVTGRLLAKPASLIHHLAEVLDLITSMISGIYCRYDECVSPLLQAIKCLIQYKVPATDYDLIGRSPLGTMMRVYGNWRSLQRTAKEYILLTDSETIPAFLSGYKYHWVFNESALHAWYCLNNQPIAQALGSGPLSLAVVANDEDQIKYILKHHPDAIKERNLLGHSPLHLAADKPRCLRLLAQAADGKVLNTRDVYGTTALEMAILLGNSWDFFATQF